MDTTRHLRLYVPTDPTVTHIAAGSAIVGSGCDEGGRILVDYEGAIYSPGRRAHFADLVEQAAGRHLESYPSVARMWASSTDLTEVGEYDVERGLVTVEADRISILCAWLGTENLDAHLATTGGRAARLREVDEYFAAHRVPAHIERQLRRRMGLA